MLTLPKSNDASATECARAMLSGNAVIIPTDTVYGISAIASSPFTQDDAGALAIRAIKGRDQAKPFIVLIANPSDITQYTADAIPHPLLDLWPGALTIVVNARHSGKASTLALRCPGDEWLRRVISLCGSPIYSTSANISGMMPLHTIKEICASFSSPAASCEAAAHISLAITDGDKAALPSTVVRLDNGHVSVLRQGNVIVPNITCYPTRRQ